MEKCNVAFAFVPDACRQMYVSYLHLLSNCLVICLRLSSRAFWNMGEFGAKKYFTDFRTTNATQIIVAIKESFCGLFFYYARHSK